MRAIKIFIISLLAIFLIVQAIFSLQWPLAHDEAPLFYEAFLMQNGKIPYKDFFDFQMPGSYIIYYLLGTLSNFGPLRIRILDIIILASIILITYLALKKINKTSAILAGILFALSYLGGGPALSLQREYLILIFLSLAIFISLQDSLTNNHRFILGLLFGLASTIKPHSAIGLIPIILFDIFPPRDSSWFKKTFYYSIGFLIPILFIIIWLASTNALTPFLAIALNYWNLYSQINGELVILSSTERLSYILNLVWHFGNHGLWLIPAAFAIYLNQNKKTYLLASLALCYAIYPAFTGQFFPYHYILFLYFIIILASLAITSHKSQVASLQSPVSNYQLLIFILVILFSIKPSQTFIRQLNNQPIVTSSDRAVEIANFLEKNLEEGDVVQPLDWTGGTLLAMLQTRTPIATEYIFDFYFYHHISNPYIQNLRNDFMNQLQESRPRFIIEITSADKPWVGGDDTTRTKFPELQNFLDENYSITIQKDDYIIYKLDNRP
ncbi:MAG: glycosyltransferase family 39 protein [Anaerolineales bacterium]|nr:glycosyltransferase family 39 protein [Anaerolineales bacterium]